MKAGQKQRLISPRNPRSFREAQRTVSRQPRRSSRILTLFNRPCFHFCAPTRGTGLLHRLWRKDRRTSSPLAGCALGNLSSSSSPPQQDAQEAQGARGCESCYTVIVPRMESDPRPAYRHTTMTRVPIHRRMYACTNGTRHSLRMTLSSKCSGVCIVIPAECPGGRTLFPAPPPFLPSPWQTGNTIAPLGPLRPAPPPPFFSLRDIIYHHRHPHGGESSA
ncbi:hypothetical protein KM043_006822 [Ampulex compressa]|nr:hypothetical protein KM043_006822 [Ampulex compressa]